MSAIRIPVDLPACSVIGACIAVLAAVVCGNRMLLRQNSGVRAEIGSYSHRAADAHIGPNSTLNVKSA